MSNERDELAKVIVAAYGEDAEAECPCEQDLEVADAILAAGYRKPRQVTTVEDMDKLAFQSVVLDAYGTPYVCERHRTDGTHNEWKPSGMDHLDDSETILYHGPAIVVHEGEGA